MIEKRISFVTEDGTEFDSEAAALCYETQQALVVMLQNSDICWHNTSAQEVAAWILENLPNGKEDL